MKEYYPVTHELVNDDMLNITLATMNWISTRDAKRVM
jgi:hypothetical protein